MDSNIVIRKATGKDTPVLLTLIHALAEYEKLPPPDAGAKERLTKDMSAAQPRFHVLLAERETNAVGYAIFFETYSSFLALPTLYLEDLFVLPEHRGMKAGFKLFQSVAKEAQERGCGRMEWAVLDWNKPAIDFYDRLGATHLKEWYNYRLVHSDFARILNLA